MRQATVLIASLKPQARNPNKMDAKQFQLLKEAIRKKGFLQPILVSEWNGQLWIVDGHHRVKAMTELGETQIEALITVLSPAEMEAVQLGMNLNRGKVSLDITEEIIRELLVDGYNAKELEGIVGMSDADIASITKDIQPPDVLAPVDMGHDATPDVATKPHTLTLHFNSKELRDQAKKALKDAAGSTKDMGLGLLNLLGLVD